MTEPIYDADCGCCMKPETREKYEASLPTPETQRIKSVEEQTIAYEARMMEIENEGKKNRLDDVEILQMHRQGFRDFLTQDRASLHTSLVEAVEGLAVDEGWKNNGIYTGGFDQAKEEFLTIINSIFKE